MRPVKQGNLDALCGVYAVVNALEQVGVVGRRSTLHRGLFEKLVLSMTPHQVRSSLICGLEAEDLLSISRKAFRWMRSAHGIDLRMRRPFVDREFEGTSDYFATLRTQSESWCHAVIIGFDLPGGSHWTTVRLIEGRRLYVRDSGRMTHLDLRRFELTQGRYRFLPADTLIIVRRL